jgi:hypothetical protein
MGSVENSAEFVTACHSLNVDLQQPGVEVNPVGVDCQQQNTVERYIQTFDNNEAAMVISQNLLGKSAWGLSGLAMTDTMNHTENELTLGSTPTFKFTGEATNMANMFLVGYGRPVICTRVRRAQGLAVPGMPRNQFGVAVGNGRAWGSTWVLFADGQRAWSICMRRHVREITLGVQKQMSIEEGKQYLPTLGPDGQTIMIPNTRGDTGILGQQFAASYNEPLGWVPEEGTGEVRIEDFDSIISYDEITRNMEETLQQQIKEHGDDIPEEFEEVHVNQQTGQLEDAKGVPVSVEVGVEEESTEEPISAPLARPQRSATAFGDRATTTCSLCRLCS